MRMVLAKNQAIFGDFSLSVFSANVAKTAANAAAEMGLLMRLATSKAFSHPMLPIPRATLHACRRTSRLWEYFFVDG